MTPKVLYKTTNSILESLPSEIGQLKNLNSIDLSRSSDLAVLPFEISQLRNLNYLNLEGCNRIKPKPSPEIMDTRQRVKNFQAKMLIAAGKDIPDYLNEKKKTSQVKKTGELLLLQQKVKWLQQDIGSHISKSSGRFY